MSRRSSLLIYIVYAVIALMAVYTGLFVYHSLLLTFVLFHLVTCLGIPIVHGLWERRLKQNLLELGVKRPQLLKYSLVAGIGSGAVLMLGVLAGFYLLLEAGVDPVWIRSVLVRWGLTPGWLWIFVIYMIVGNSFFEELMWRGFIYERLQRILLPILANLLSSFFYSSYHVLLGVVLFGWRWGLLIAGLAWLMGIFWTILVRQYGSLMSAWLSHLLVDAGIMISLIHWVMDGS